MNDNLKTVVDYAFQDDAVKMRDALYNEINAIVTTPWFKSTNLST